MPIGAQEMAVATLISATTVIRRTHAKATIVKCLTGNDQEYNEANLMLTKHYKRVMKGYDREEIGGDANNENSAELQYSTNLQLSWQGKPLILVILVLSFKCTYDFNIVSLAGLVTLLVTLDK
jgi:hypothetical protein